MFFSFFSSLKRFIGDICSVFWNQPENSNAVYCSCGNNLVADGSFVSDTDETDGNHVIYCCKKCGVMSDWDFDIAPVPFRRPFGEPCKPEYSSSFIDECYRDSGCRIINLETGKTVKARGERWLRS